VVLEEVGPLGAVVHAAFVVAGDDPAAGGERRAGNAAHDQGGDEGQDGEPSAHLTSPFPGPESRG